MKGTEWHSSREDGSLSVGCRGWVDVCCTKGAISTEEEEKILRHLDNGGKREE